VRGDVEIKSEVVVDLVGKSILHDPHLLHPDSCVVTKSGANVRPQSPSVVGRTLER
jgi:hypothetical protein